MQQVQRCRIKACTVLGANIILYLLLLSNLLVGNPMGNPLGLHLYLSPPMGNIQSLHRHSMQLLYTTQPTRIMFTILALCSVSRPTFSRNHGIQSCLVRVNNQPSGTGTDVAVTLLVSVHSLTISCWCC